jgi:hypothetical protein
MRMPPQLTDERVTWSSEPDLLALLVADGRPLLALFAVGLFVSGVFALFLAATVTFLPQDIAFLGMQPADLCALHQCRLVHFLFHDRVSFGGTLMAIGMLYLWLITVPLKRGEAWAWWTFALSGTVGFLSFLTWLIYHYLDTWHLTASAALLPLYVCGMAITWNRLVRSNGDSVGIRTLFSPAEKLEWRTRAGFGRACLLFVGIGMVMAGLTISILGSTVVFVPQDLTYFGYSPAQLTAINPHLIPLIAHDRAGFGGGLASCGLCVFLIVWEARATRALWQALLCAGCIGFGCAIGIHYPMGYLSVSHLAPAWAGALIYLIGIVCLRPGPIADAEREAGVIAEAD